MSVSLFCVKSLATRLFLDAYKRDDDEKWSFIKLAHKRRTVKTHSVTFVFIALVSPM